MEDLVKNLKPIVNKTEPAGLDMFLPREIDNIERNNLFKKFNDVMIMGSPKLDDVFSVLYGYFNENKFSQDFIEKYYDTYWSFFVKLGWQLLSKLQDNIFVNFVAYTVPYAVSEHVNVKDKLLTELFLLEPPMAQSIYNDIKKIITSLNYPIAFNSDGKKIILSDLMKQYSNQQKLDDSVQSEMFRRIQKALFPDIENDAAEVKKSAAQSAKDFIELLSFFSKDIKEVSEYAGDYYRNRPENVDLEIDKELYGQIGAGLVEEFSAAEKLVKTSFIEELPKHKQDFIVWIADAQTLRGLLDWMKTFETGAKGREVLQSVLEKTLGAESLDNTDAVMAVAGLNEFLIKNNYSGDDLIHFDEQSEKFK